LIDKGQLKAPPDALRALFLKPHFAEV